MKNSQEITTNTAQTIYVISDNCPIGYPNCGMPNTGTLAAMCETDLEIFDNLDDFFNALERDGEH